MSSIISVHKSSFSLKPRLTLKFTASSQGHKLVVISWVPLCFPWAESWQQSKGSKFDISKVWKWPPAAADFQGPTTATLHSACVPLQHLLMHQHLGPTHLHFIFKVISGFFTLSWVISCFCTMHQGALHEIQFLISSKIYFGFLNSNYTDSYPPGINTLVILNKCMLFQ